MFLIKIFWLLTGSELEKDIRIQKSILCAVGQVIDCHLCFSFLARHFPVLNGFPDEMLNVIALTITSSMTF